MGYRLSGEPVESPATNMLSEGIALGAIQIPKDGQPIILLNDRQTIGGYPKLGCVARIDLPRLAQAKPGQQVTFLRVTVWGYKMFGANGLGSLDIKSPHYIKPSVSSIHYKTRGTLK